MERALVRLRESARAETFEPALLLTVRLPEGGERVVASECVVVDDLVVWTASDLTDVLRLQAESARLGRIVEESLRGYRQCAATARRYEISRALLTRWRREFRSGHLVADGRPRFMAVQIAPDAANSAARQPPVSPSSSNNDRIEITLANGRKIAVGTTIDPMVLGRLVQVLDRA